MKVFKEIGRNPHIDWMAILLISVATAIGLAITSFYLYNAVVSGSIKGDDKKRASFTKIDEKVISSALKRFEEREERSEAARAGYSGVTDPSI